MNETTAKSLVTSLINAAFEAGMWHGNPNQTMEPHWKEKAEKVGDEIVRHLSEASIRPDKCSAESHALKRMGGYSICPVCDEDISGG